ncbi:DUF2971 domain-containing protein [Treponema sp. C6A8]|uniref:DUF2971 domain-containing protein n=1 Tax=Treponema sp. C6A8 TaxID=1410609 RepID=UPI0004866F29|nr:DUF2971 domain-containing protein [Treponema sp. C6A8]
MDLLSTLTNYSDDTQELLFHYTSFKSASQIIESNQLKLSSLPNTNDPLEFVSPEIFSFTIWADMDEQKILYDLTESKNRRNDYVRFLCFCRNLTWNEMPTVQQIADNFLFKGWARTRMWAQYADNHTGVCLVFDKKEFKKCFDNLKSNNITIINDRKIEYTNCLTNYQVLMTDIHHYNDNFKDFFLDKKRLECLFLKCEDFKDEMEYRFCLVNRNLKNSEEQMFVNYGKSLKAIIYGQRFDKKQRIPVPKSVDEYKIRWFFGMPKLF